MRVLLLTFLAGLLLGANVPWRRLLTAPLRSASGRARRDDQKANDDAQTDNAAFRDASAKLLHAVASIDSPINAQELQAFEKQFLKIFSLEDPDERSSLIDSFRNGELEGRNLAEGIANFYWKFSGRKKELLTLTQIAIELIISDGAKNGSEAHVLDVLARTLGIHPKDLFRMEEQILQDYYERMGYASSQSSSRAKAGSRSSSQSQQHNRQGRAGFQKNDSTLQSLALSKYYRILGCGPSAKRSEIKRSYRKLAKQHHPDQAKGRSRDNSRFHEIQGAYDALRRAGKV